MYFPFYAISELKFLDIQEIKNNDEIYTVSSGTQDVDWTYMGRSEDVQDVFWTSYIRSIYVLFPGG